MDPMTTTILAGVLAIGGVGGVMYALFANQFVAEARRGRRLASIGGVQAAHKRAAQTGDAKAQSAAQKRIKELADKERNQKKKRFDVSGRLVQAGLSMSPAAFLLTFQGVGVAVAAIALALGQQPLIAVAAGATVAFGLPRVVLSKLIKRRQRMFIENFANAIDVLIRGVRSGLPVGEGLKIISNEIPEPVSGEFRKLIDAVAVGVSLEDGLQRMYERVPIAEVNFFRTVLVIQKQTGGNLAEALSNLSGILRDRRKLKGKIRALSSEARTSAMIIGSLPFLVGLMVYFVTPDYLLPLFQTSMGNMMIAGGLIWMSFGIMMMRAMINFDM